MSTNGNKEQQQRDRTCALAIIMSSLQEINLVNWQSQLVHTKPLQFCCKWAATPMSIVSSWAQVL